MLGNLHVRFGVGAGVQFHGLHHAPIGAIMPLPCEQRSLAPLVCLPVKKKRRFPDFLPPAVPLARRWG